MKLEISGLSFSYSDRDVLDQLDIQVGEGEFVSILGASGCGKSTILKLLTSAHPCGGKNRCGRRGDSRNDGAFCLHASE